MAIMLLVLSAAGWICVAMVFESGFQVLKQNAGSRIQKPSWCWLWWSALGVLSFATGGAAGLVQVAIIFCIAASHIKLCELHEDVISPIEIIRHVPAALREVFARFRRI